MIYLAIILAVALACATCTAIGFAHPGTLASFRPDNQPVTRHFHQKPDEVVAAYVSAVSRTPGMRLFERAGTTLLIDVRPTTRIIDGNFGLVARLSISGDHYGSVVRLDSRNKVRLALLSNHHAAVVHAERALRQNAKQCGLVEAIPGVNA